MKHTCHIKMRATLWAILGVVGLVSMPPMAYGQSHCQSYWTAAYKCSQGCGSCGGGGNHAPSHDNEAERRAQEAQVRRAKANAFNNEGIAAQNRGQWGIAAEQYRQAYAWNPESKIIFDNLINAQYKVGLIALEEGDWNYAETNFSSLLYHKPDSAEFKRLLAIAEGKLEAARQAFELNRKALIPFLIKNSINLR